MALRVRRSAALLLAAIVLSGCEQGGPFGQPSGGPAGNPAVSQTGTQTVKQRIVQLRADQQALAGGISRQQELLASTRSQIASDTSSYSSHVNAVTSRLQAGTTPGNPELVAQWNDAQAKLDAITLAVGTLNSLASQVTTQASVAGYLVDNVRATYSVGGAVEEDHRQLRSIVAQRQVLGIELHALEQALMRRWHLPELLARITADQQSRDPQVRSVQLAVRLARHSARGWDDTAIPDDVHDIAELLNLGLEPTLKLLREFD